jgi:hypothetical protein
VLLHGIPVYPDPQLISIDRFGSENTSDIGVNFLITFDRPVTGVDKTDVFLVKTGSVNATLGEVSYHGDIQGEELFDQYIVEVKNLTGDGKLSLNLIDDNSIKSDSDITKSLFPPGVGTIFEGATYTVDHTPPVVESIRCNDVSPTTASKVGFRVTFSEAVTGVDATDFQLVRSGIAMAPISGMAVTKISDSTYDVNVSNVPAYGALGLNLMDNGKVKDLAGNVYTSRNDVAGFANQTTYATGLNPEAVMLGDVNRDGIPDLVVANGTSDTMSVFLGNGNGEYKAPFTYRTGHHPSSVALGDLNDDGFQDVAVTNSLSNTLSVFLGIGNGAFKTQQVFATEKGPDSVTFGYVNTDEKLDLIVANSASNSVSLFDGKGDGTIQLRKSYATGNSPNSVLFKDLSGVGDYGIVVANYNSGTVSVLMGHPDGTFDAPRTFSTVSATGWTPNTLALGDVNGDHKPDLIVGSFFAQYSNICLLLGNGNGTFKMPQTFAQGSTPMALAVGDVNGDGKLDIAIANHYRHSVDVFLGNGDATFNLPQTFATGTSPIGLSIGDLNADGKLDLVVANLNSNNVSVFLGKGNGNLNVQVYKVGITPSVTTQPKNLQIHLDGTATFTAEAVGNPTPSIQWQVSTNDVATWSNLAGAISNTYRIATDLSMDQSKYRAVFVNSAGVAYSDAATLAINTMSVAAKVTSISLPWGDFSYPLNDISNGLLLPKGLLPTGRKTDIPWLGVQTFIIGLDRAVSSLKPEDISVVGVGGIDYGCSEVFSVNGSFWRISLKNSISIADKITLSIGNGDLKFYVRTLSILPGDMNDDGVVSAADMTLINNATIGPYNVFADLNGDGKVDIDDVKLARRRIGTRLPR